MAAPEVHRTKRLRLRPVAEADARAMARLLENDPEATGMTERMPIPFTERAARDWIRACQGPGEHVFALEHAQSGELVGCAGYTLSGDTAALGYWLGRPFWNQGFATEAVEKLVELARGIGIERVFADSFPENAPSQRLLEKLGFTETEQVDKDLPERGGRKTLKRFVRAL